MMSWWLSIESWRRKPAERHRCKYGRGAKKRRQARARRRDIRDGRGQPVLDVGSQLESFSSPPGASWCIFWSQRRFTRGSNWKAEAVWNAAGRPPLGAGNPWFGPLAFRATSSYNWHTACTGSQPLTWENCLALNKQACPALIGRTQYALHLLAFHNFAPPLTF